MRRARSFSRFDRRRWATLLPAAALLLPAAEASAPARLRFAATDEAGQACPCRIHLSDAQGKPLRAPALPFWHDHFVCGGSVELELPAGKYRYDLERGPEFVPVRGEIDVAQGQTAEVRAALRRLTDLAAAGWWSGDLHIHRPLEDIELLAQAEDLHIAPVITWWNDRNPWSERSPPWPTWRPCDETRFIDALAGEDEREGGALLYFHLDRPLPLAGAGREFPPPLAFARQARAENPRAWIDVEKPFWWDVPVWVASGLADSIGLANNHMCRSTMLADEAWGRPRDRQRLPDPQGNGYWSQEIYYHLLNCGLRLPPSAGSASGVLPNPVGYNRVYVQLPGPLTYEAWWEGLRAGRSFVSNGPLLLVQANGQLAGHVFRLPAAGPLELELDVQLWSNDPVTAIQIVRDGRVAQEVPVVDRRGGRLEARLSLDQPGWFLVRAIAQRPETFRFGSTAPFYVEGPAGERRIHRRSAQFFVDWVDERVRRVEANVVDVAQRRAVLADHEVARLFWGDVLARSSGD
jgi:hypothetical protein